MSNQRAKLSKFMAIVIATSQVFLAVGCLNRGGGDGASLMPGLQASSAPAPAAPAPSTGSSGTTARKPVNTFKNKIVPLGAKVNAKTDETEIRVVGAGDKGEALSTTDIKDSTVVAVDDKGNETEVKPGDVTIAEEDAAEAAALRLSLVADLSGSMSSTEVADMRKVQVGLLKSLPRIFEGELILFSKEVVQKVDWTNDIDKLLAGTEADPGFKRSTTALFDAIEVSLKHLIDSKVASSKIMAVMTDGQENASRSATKDKLISMVQESGVHIVMIGTKDADVQTMQDVMGQDGVFFYSDDFAGIQAQMKSYFDALNKMTKIRVSGKHKNAAGFKIKAKARNLQTAVKLRK